MKLTLWNVNAPKKQHLLKCNLSFFESDIILIQENKLNKKKGNKLKKRMELWKAEKVEYAGASWGLAISSGLRKVDF